MLMLDRSAAKRCGPANPSKAVSRIKALVGVRELSVIGVIQRAMMKPKQIATAATAPRGSIAAQYGLHAESRPHCLPAVQLLRCAGLTALLHETVRFPAAGEAAPLILIRRNYTW